MPRTAGTVNKDYVPVDLDDLAGLTFATPDEAKGLAPKTIGAKPAERTGVMLKLDEWCQESYNFWSKNNHPTPFTDAFPPVKVPVSPDKAPSIRLLARKSAQFLEHGIRFGTDTPTTDGRVIVSFCCTDKKERKAKPAS